MTEALPDLLTGRQVCDLMNVSYSTLQPWRESGQLVALAIPGGWRYPREQPLIRRALDAIRAAS